jgi:predicted transcriptional regulator
MSVTIELSDEMETALNALALARGVPVPDVIRSLLESQLPQSISQLSAAERAEAWRTSTRGLPLGTPLSDESVSRSSIYGSRG